MEVNTDKAYPRLNPATRANSTLSYRPCSSLHSCCSTTRAPARISSPPGLPTQPPEPPARLPPTRAPPRFMADVDARPTCSATRPPLPARAPPRPDSSPARQAGTHPCSSPTRLLPRPVARAPTWPSSSPRRVKPSLHRPCSCPASQVVLLRAARKVSSTCVTFTLEW
jgi:hypothetical protein